MSGRGASLPSCVILARKGEVEGSQSIKKRAAQRQFSFFMVGEGILLSFSPIGSFFEKIFRKNIVRRLFESF